MKEIWKDIKGYEGLYQVSNLGKVRSLDRKILFKNGHIQFFKGKILSLSKDKNGYIHIILHKDNKTKIFRVHRLVAETFIPNLENKPQVNHIDGNKENNCLSNLEYCTIKENHIHAYRTGLHNAPKKKCIQKDLNGNIIKNWDSLKQIKLELGYDCSAISRCCRNIQKTSYNFIWDFAD